jgi:hypothetical protein
MISASLFKVILSQQLHEVHINIIITDVYLHYAMITPAKCGVCIINLHLVELPTFPTVHSLLKPVPL